MTPHDQILNNAAGMLALPASDPERVQALMHAAGCDQCRQALAEGERLLALLDAIPRPPAPGADALRRVSDAIARELAAEVLAQGKMPARPRRRPAFAVAWAAIGASLLLSLLIGHGSLLRALLGVKCLAIELAASLLPVALVGVLVARRAVVAAGPSLYAGAAAVGALAGHVWLHATCRASVERPHLLVFHTGGVLLAAALGALLSRIPFLRAR